MLTTILLFLSFRQAYPHTSYFCIIEGQACCHPNNEKGRKGRETNKKHKKRKRKNQDEYASNTKIGKVSKERNKEKEKMNQTKIFMEMWSIQAPIKMNIYFYFQVIKVLSSHISQLKKKKNSQ